MDESIQYLLKAIESSKDARLQHREELPLTETYLNVANAYSFLNQYEKAIEHAENANIHATNSCKRLEELSLQIVGAAEQEQLRTQYNCQIKFKILSIHTKGTNYEKLKLYSKAHDQFKKGKMIVEQYLGCDDQSYAMFCSAMNGAKLKTKYQTPSENRRKSKSRSRSKSDDKKKKGSKKNQDLPSVSSRSQKSRRP